MQSQIPNSLTWLRLFIGLIFPLVPPAWWLPLVIVGGLSDVFDGWLSRKWGQTTDFGQLLDPIADKVFVLAVAITLLMHHRLTAGDLVGVAARDLTVTILAAVALFSRRFNTRELRPRWTGKAATAAQFVLLGILLISSVRPVWMITLTTAVSVVAAFDYALIAWSKWRTQ